MAQVDNSTHTLNQTVNYLDKISLFIGSTGSGKTTLVVDALHAVKNHLHDFNIICPATSDYSYRSMDLGDKLYDTISVEEMNELYARIERRSVIARLCNTQSILDDLCIKLGVDPSKLDPLDKFVITLPDEPEYVFHNAKHVVRENIDELSNLELTSVERTVVEHININPRTCIVFDDSAELFMNLCKNSKLGRLIWNAKDLNVTLLVVLPDYTPFNTRISKANNLVFTNESAAHHFINKKHNGMRENERALALTILANHSWTNYRKFVLVSTAYDIHPHWHPSATLATVHDDFTL